MNDNELLLDAYIAATTVPWAEVVIFAGLVIGFAVPAMCALMWLTAPIPIRRFFEGYRGAGF